MAIAFHLVRIQFYITILRLTFSSLASLPAGFKTAKFAEVEIIESQDATTCTAWENSDCTGASAVFASSTNFTFTSLGAVAGNVGAYQC
jgi:hypothetical protein